MHISKLSLNLTPNLISLTEVLTKSISTPNFTSQNLSLKFFRFGLFLYFFVASSRRFELAKKQLNLSLNALLLWAWHLPEQFDIELGSSPRQFSVFYLVSLFGAKQNPGKLP